MILDKLLTFADKHALTASGVSDVIDRGADAPTLANFGGGFAGPLFLVIQTTAAFAGLTSVTAELVSDSTATLATSPTVHASTGAVPVADLSAHKIVAVLPVPPGDYKRYIGVRWTVAGTGTAGTISAFLTQTPEFYRAMAANNPPAHN